MCKSLREREGEGGREGERESERECVPEREREGERYVCVRMHICILIMLMHTDRNHVH